VINIVVADDWALVRSGFRALVCQWPSCVPRWWPLKVLTSRACSASSRSSFLPPGCEVGGGGCCLLGVAAGCFLGLLARRRRQAAVRQAGEQKRLADPTGGL